LRLHGFLRRPRFGGGELTRQELNPVLQDLALGRENLKAGFENMQTRQVAQADGSGVGRKRGHNGMCGH
jgi:hypothetical protein